MIKHIPYLCLSAFLMSACGGESSNTTSSTDTPNNTPISATPDVTLGTGSKPFTCNATMATQSAFTDTFIENGTADIEWSSAAANISVSVSEIASAFNDARALDPTIKQKLLMPLQADWDAMTTSEKGLFLVNSERCARGLPPFEAIAPELINSTSKYADELSDSGAFSHTHGVYPNPSARIEGYAGVDVGTNADWMAQTENLSRHVSGFSAGYPTIYEPIARAMYTYMYADTSSNYGHRTLILINVDNENSGEAGAEGLFALSKTTKQYKDSEFFKTDVTSVMHVFDPNEAWDMSNVLPAPTTYGPEAASDCLSGTFSESTDIDGNNTSTCL
ncbi:hypothetical protein EOL70_19795 [Leucothrix sargassi]|nr:hypothetical protein EOL70_19795 [Leucothrix sargassi]